MVPANIDIFLPRIILPLIRNFTWNKVHKIPHENCCILVLITKCTPAPNLSLSLQTVFTRKGRQINTELAFFGPGNPIIHTLLTGSPALRGLPLLKAYSLFLQPGKCPEYAVLLRSVPEERTDSSTHWHLTTPEFTCLPIYHTALESIFFPRSVF